MEEYLIDKIIKEYEELKKYKDKYRHLKEDKKRMSIALLKYELKEYKKTPYKERVEKHIKEKCENCRWFYGENINCKWLEGSPKERLPKDILIPIESEENYFPEHKICEDICYDD